MFDQRSADKVVRVWMMDRSWSTFATFVRWTTVAGREYAVIRHSNGAVDAVPSDRVEAVR